MVIVKSALVGFAAAVVSSGLFVVVTLTIAREQSPGSNILISGPITLIVATIMFVACFAWESRRLRRRYHADGPGTQISALPEAA
jgi:hypothetical protein